MTRDLEKRPATIYDVARHAGVSHQTVSRLIKGSSNIAPELAERIHLAISELGYRRNVAARSLALRKLDVIGVLTAGVSEYGPSRTLQGVTQAAREAGFLVDVINVNPADLSDLEHAVQVFRSRQLAGILAMAPAEQVLAAATSVTFDVPVEIWQEASDRVGGTTMSVNELGQELLVKELFAQGHRRFAALSGPTADWISARHRHDGLTAALSRRSLQLIAEVAGDWSAKSGYDAALAVELRGATALIAGNDQMALGAMLALHERGYRVPDDISVVGFDDIPEAAYFNPPLTTVRQDFADQGRIAITRLLAQLEGGAGAVATNQAEPLLVIRQSCGPAPL